MVIYERARYSGSLVGSKTLPLLGTKLGSQTLTVVKEKMNLKVIYNIAILFGSARNYKSYGI